MQARIKRPKSLITIHNVSQNTPEWHELRNGLHTASNAIHLLTGKNPPKNVHETAAMRRGKQLESEALELYSKIRGDLDILTVGFVTNSRYPNAGVSPDGVVDRLIEVKCFNPRKHRAAAKQLPVEVIAQVQMQMLVCELDKCDVVLYNPDLDASEALYIVTVRKDERIQQNIIKHLKELYEN